MQTDTAPSLHKSTRTPPNLEIPVRKMDFAIPDGLYNGFPGRPGETIFLAILSLMFPEGEQFFVDSVHHYRTRIGDPVLTKQVRSFIGQEAQHSLQHKKYNEKLAQGLLPLGPVNKAIGWGFAATRSVLPARTQLAGTAAAEHMTAMLAEQVLNNPAVTEGADPVHKALWMWHAVEETEHKAVAFDVYRSIGGGYLHRVLVMAALTLFTVPGLAAAMIVLMAKEGHLFSGKAWGSFFRWSLGKRGLIRRALPTYFDYYRPGFHPWDHDNSGDVAVWKAAYGASVPA